MEIDKMLKNVNNLNDYIFVSQSVHATPVNYKMHFNMSTVLSLKKVRAYEIEYFNKCEGSGAALLLLEHMIKLPPSKTWVLLGRELVSLLQYWLDAMRKHLVKHNHNWWNFLKILLKFIKSIKKKDPSLPSILLEYTAECLLDLATGSEPDILQRLEILICLNMCCEGSSRDIRISLRERLDSYLLKLSVILSSCGHWPTQYSLVENLMRWLVPRQDFALRQALAAKWVPQRVVGEAAYNVFLERSWQNFYQDARDFLGAFNEKSGLVVSVVCRKASIGNIVLVSGDENRESWLDINRADSSISMVVSPKVVEALGQPVEVIETLILPVDTIQRIRIYKEASDVVVSVETSHASRLFPSGAELGGSLTVVVSQRHARTLDTVLRSIYRQRYELLVDLINTSSPQDNVEKKKMAVSLEEDTRFSHPYEPQRRKHSGYMVRSQYPAAWKSPSSVSTSSLAQLHEKLAQLPRYDFEKEAVHVCALPELSTVTEVSELDDRSSLASVSTVKLNRPHGVCQKNIRNEIKSQSDGELHTKTKPGRHLSPAEKIDENSTSCLLVATVGSDESVINETIERYSKSKDFRGDNIVDLIVQEALNADFQAKDKLTDSGINTGDNRKTPEPEMNSEAIENTPTENKKAENKTKQDCEKPCTVISNTTTDESNDVVDDTPLKFVNVRKRQKEPKETVAISNVDQRPAFDVQEVENFFTQHLNENQRGEIVISPTLARKINETSSESDHFEECLLDADNAENVNQKDVQDVDLTAQDNVIDTEVAEKIAHVNEVQFQEIDIIECLNSMVDKVCSDLEKCADLLNKDLNLEMIEEAIVNSSNAPLQDTTNIDKKSEKEKSSPMVSPKKIIKLKFPAKKTVKKRTNTGKKNKKLELESIPKMSPIVEATNPTVDSSEKEKTPERTILDMPIILRRKRKLYSPKDENLAQKQNLVTKKQNEVLQEEEDNDFKATKIRTPVYKATSYKDIEEDRKKTVRKPRSKRSRAKLERTPSPRTKKMNDIFDHLKDKIESNDSIILADKKQAQDLAIYNLTDDSEDEDFKKKKIEVSKRLSSTTIASGDSSMSTRHGRTVNRVNYSESKSSDEAKNAVIQRPKRTRRKRQPKAPQIKKEKNLQDERMRKNVLEDLNTSIIVEKPVQKPVEEPDLVLVEPPQMETIPDEVVESKPPKKTKQGKKTDALSLKKDKTAHKQNYKPLPRETVDDGKESPLPVLLVEAIPERQDDINDSISVNMLQKKLQKIQAGLESSVNETNTTQNLLSDVEKINYSPPQINITEEFNKIENETVFVETKELSNARNSKPPKLTNDELISILEHASQSNTKTKNKKDHSKNVSQKSVEKVEITEISDSKSANSIATLGKSPITAHGDSNEEPPDTIHLLEDYQHRDVGIEDFNQSVKEYLYKLRDETTAPKISESNESDDTVKVTKKVRSSIEKSPVVSICRLSIDDISRWLPSRRTSDTDSSYSEKKSENASQRAIVEEKNSSVYNSKKNKPVIEQNEDSILEIEESVKPCPRRKNRRDEKDSENPDNSDSDVPLRKQEYKIKKRSDKILDNVVEQSKDENQPVYNPKKKKPVKENIVDSVLEVKEQVKSHPRRKNRKEEKSKILPNPDDTDSDADVPLIQHQPKTKKTSDKILHNVLEQYKYENQNIMSSRKKHKTKVVTPSPVPNKTPVKTSRNKPATNRKSIISPIKIFDDILPAHYSTEESEASQPEISNSLSKKQRKPEMKLELDDLRNMNKSRYMQENLGVSSVESKSNTSNKIKPKENRKRKSNSPPKEYDKRRRLEKPDVNLSGSDRSVSSVNEWFRKIAPVDRAESVNASLTEAIDNVMEKLDTTLVEIHQNTSKKFIHMFVDAQRHLQAVKQERRQMYRSVASDILAEVVKLLDAKFADLDKRSQEMDEQFMNNLKSQALDFIREDCKKKQVMVSLLREDVQAVIDHVAQRNKDHY